MTKTKEELIKEINKIEPGNYETWTLNELQELALFLEINLNNEE